MGLNDLKDKNRNELSMIEVARAILEDHGKRMAFADIVNAIQKYLHKSDEDIRKRLPQFYTDMNTNGDFISMGENVWVLRSWFPYESVDEEVNHPEDEDDDDDTRKHHKKVNAFLADATGSDDIIDYDNDDRSAFFIFSSVQSFFNCDNCPSIPSGKSSSLDSFSSS